MPYRKSVKLKDILLWEDNPRYEEQENEEAEMLEIIKKNKLKIYNLAKDVYNNGIVEEILLYNDNNKMYVYDGNRRICAFKLIKNPSILKDLYPKLYEKFSQLNYKDAHSHQIPAHIFDFDEKEDLLERVELRHSGAQEGVGQLSWDPFAKNRFNQIRNGKKDFVHEMIDFIESNDYVPDYIIVKITKTCWERVLGSSVGKKYLGARFIESEIFIDDIDSFKLKIREIANELYGQTVRIVYDTKSIKVLLNKVDKKLYPEKYENEPVQTSFDEHTDGSDASKTPNYRATDSTYSDGAQNSSNSSQNTTPTPSKPTKPKLRNNLVPDYFAVNVLQTETRIYAIYYELLTLNVHKFPNSVAVLFRVFIEMSIDYYLKNKGISFIEGAKLIKKLELTLTHMKSNNLIDDEGAKPVNVCISNKDSILSTHTFNAYVHNPSMIPHEKDLLTAWDNLQIFIKILWS